MEPNQRKNITPFSSVNKKLPPPKKILLLISPPLTCAKEDRDEKQSPISVILNKDFSPFIVLKMKIQFTKKESDIRRMKTGCQCISRAVKFFAFMLMVFIEAGLFAQGNEQPNGQIAPELIGKWCFINLAAGTGDVITNSCIT